MNGKMDFSKSDLSELKKFAKKSSKVFTKAQKKASLQLLTWMNTGSGGTPESRKPPIRWGILRGSSSAFVGDQKVGDFRINVKPGSKEQISPATSYVAPPGTTTIVYNTAYAAKMHELPGPWGEFTEQDGDAGAKWIERHLQTDKDLFMKVIGIEFKKDMHL